MYHTCVSVCGCTCVTYRFECLSLAGGARRRRGGPE